jgi:poly(A) polymerase
MKNEEEEQTVLEHTLNVMRHYPEELPYDWYGTLACMFHAVGKLYTAEYFDGKWTFHNYPRLGAKVVRKILSRLRVLPIDADLVCQLVRNHTRFHYMLTDKGIRRFKALDEYPRLIEMARADVKARGGNYTEFNHNMKMLDRADLPEERLEPLLNGNEIMEFTGLKPGPIVGIIRDCLLKAQIEGEVNNVPEAVEYVQRLKDQEFVNE